MNVMRNVVAFAATIGLICGVVACEGGDAGGPEAKAVASEKPTKAAPSTLLERLPRSGLPGKVQEVHHAGGYSYVRARTGDGDIWVAVTEVEVEVGDDVVVAAGTRMTDFHSKSLNMTFDQIFFVEYLKGARAKAAPKGAPASAAGSQPASAAGSQPAAGAGSQPAAGAGSQPGSADSRYKPDSARGGPSPHDKVSPGANTPNPQIDIGGITKPEGGQTVNDVFVQRQALSGKPIKVRARVVKFNAAIMGKNWLHLQDGTGDVAQKTHDLTVTTSATAKVGDLVLVEGTLTLDKDFGLGYRYDLIVEDAKVTVETP